ncbi:hypothetical protein R3P38DRAFT_2970560 [Favolaschia claudopus]|uniref:Fungal-type protein kinase domain-containing protein n=1 Tax=Favolaschia claudopus TaxID=2862362 RepID=A0AAW0B1H5_9AGAR
MMSEYVAGVPQVPLEFFFDNILPRSAQWHSLVEHLLVDEGHIVSGRWLQKASGSTRAERETDFISIVNTVIRAGDKLAPHHSTCRLTLPPATAPKSCHPLPLDAQFELVDSGSHSSIAIPWRIRHTRVPPDSNEDELVSRCQKLLSDDACRRFSYGITIEDDSLRVWFFSRSHELVSSSFDCIAEVPSFIRLVLSLAFATPEQLGYDTTMSHVADAVGSAQVRLTVGNNAYITTRLLSERDQDGCCGRSTRVWEAYREDDLERTPIAVKDVWASADAVQEGHQLLELHEKLRTLSHPSLPRPPEQYFLTVIEHGFVSTSDGVDDDTLIMTSGVLPDGVSEQRRKHYRIVFKEVGVPIHNLQSLPEVMQALADATRALQLLYALGLVHRDVSSGNILLVGGMGRLTDLEFMRPYKGPITSSPADRFIGTADFIAGEVGINQYCYALSRYRPSDAPRRSENPPFRYNPFHDLESTLWIGIWVLFYHRQNLPECKQFFDMHFPPHFTETTLNDRKLAISWGFLSLEESDSFHSILEILHGIRNQLLERYTLFESDIHRKYHFIEDEAAPSIGSPFDGLHDALIHEYEEAARLSDGQLIPFPRSGASKRKATSEPSLGVDITDATMAPSPERAPKKLKSTSPRRPPTTRSSDGGRRRNRSSNTGPTRHSARLAEKKRSPTRTDAK